MWRLKLEPSLFFHRGCYQLASPPFQPHVQASAHDGGEIGAFGFQHQGDDEAEVEIEREREVCTRPGSSPFIVYVVKITVLFLQKKMREKMSVVSRRALEFGLFHGS